MVQLGRGDLLGALQASPLVLLGGPLWALWPRVGPALASRVPRRRAYAALFAALAASQAWQLHRYLG